MNDLIFSYAGDDASLIKRKLIRLVEVATGQRVIRRIYLEHTRNPVPAESFFQSAVRRLALDVRFDLAALARIPRSGPLVVVANHPYGVLDGIVVSWLIEKVRRDFLVLTNAVLLRAPDLRPHVLAVDFSHTSEALKTNLQSRAAARAHLDAGGCVVVFPAGGVSTTPDRLGRRPAIDAPWQPFIAQLIHKAKAVVVPVCFEGQNSRVFQIASHLSPTLRIALIFREVKRRIGTAIAVEIGRPIAYDEIANARDRRHLADDLRRRTYELGREGSHKDRSLSPDRRKVA